MRADLGRSSAKQLLGSLSALLAMATPMSLPEGVALMGSWGSADAEGAVCRGRLAIGADRTPKPHRLFTKSGMTWPAVKVNTT